MTARQGRRPGHADTRSEILHAARALFAEDGYADASLRAIARRAGVDPALVHHYFSDKSELFVQSMELPVDPQAVAQAVAGTTFSGERLVEGFLAQWEDGEGTESPSFVAMVQAMAASPQAATAMREFLAERITVHGAPDESRQTGERRRALVCSQLLGLGWVRYVMRLEPLASAPRAAVAHDAGPTVERYALGKLPPGP